MSRRHVRARSELGDLVSAVRSLHPFTDSGVETVRAGIASGLERYVLPRLGDHPLPLVIAFVGPTGAGKSTVINALAGRVVSRAGVLRPTTKRSTIWTKPAFRPVMEVLGEVVEDDHPLLDTVALVDTPDLDSNVQGHYEEAMAAIQSSDAVVFVTTAARYGDALPWRVLRELADRFAMPLALLLNRVPSRAGGARNDLLSRLRQIGLGQIRVLSISEQRIDSERGLSRVAVQRLSALIRDWAANATERRQRTFDLVSDQLSADLRDLIQATRERQRVGASLVQAMDARYDMAQGQVLHLVSTVPKKRTRFFLRSTRNEMELLRTTVLAIIDQAAEDTGRLWAESGINVPPEYLRASPQTASALNRLTSTEEVSEWSTIAATDRIRFSSLLSADPPETASRMEEAEETLATLTLAGLNLTR